MTQSIQNFDNRNNGYGVQPKGLPPQAAPRQVSVQIPDYYAPNDKKSLKEFLEESPIYTMGIKGFFGPLIDHPIASLFTWFGCGFLLDKYTEACSGEYNKSLLKKVTNFGDSIEKSQFIQSKPMQKVLGWFSKGGGKCHNIIQNNSVLRAIWNTPTMPEWDLVKSEMIPQRQRVVHDFNHIVNELKLTTDGYAKLNNLALDKDERRILKSMAETLNTEEKASSYIQLKRLGVKEKDILNVISKSDGGVAETKKAILKALGDKDVKWLKAVHGDTIGDPKIISQVQEATKKVGNKVRISLADYKPFGFNLGILTTPTKRVLSCDNVFNRLYSLEGGAKTATGRFMSKFMQMIHRGLTFGGGKLGVLLFIAPAFVETAINVHKAEPNQKIGTGVSNLTNHISWVFTFPIALQMMHHICGAKYAGMKEDDIKKIRDKVAEINEKNKKNGIIGEGFKNFADWNKERENVNKFIKQHSTVKNQKWYTKGIRKLASWLTPDLEKVDAYNTGNWVSTKFSQLRNLPRNLFGVPARLILFGLLTMGVLDTILNKTIKLIFGDSYDSMKEEEIKDAKKEQKKFTKEDLDDRLYEAQKQKMINYARKNGAKPQQKTQQNNAIAHHGAGENSAAIPQIEQTKVDNYSYIPSQQNVIKTQSKGKSDNYTYIPSQNSTIQPKDNNKQENNRSYIPSQLGANISKTWDNSGMQDVFNRADRAEQKALQVLAGNFDGM